MMLRLLLTGLVVLQVSMACGQAIQKVFVRSKDPDKLYLGGKQTDSLFYYATVPPGKVRGLLVLLPGYMQQAESIFKETQLAREAYQAGIATIIPTINGRLYLDAAGKAFLNAVLAQATATHGIAKDRVVVGGFSAGGLLALAYAEAAHQDGKSTALVPKAVFGVDCPTDLANLWDRFAVTIERNCSPPLVGEAKFVQNIFTTQFLGPPGQYPDKYIAASAFSRREKEGGNAKYLRTTPTRLYCEPDMDFYLKQLCADFYDTNAPDLSAMINQLRMLGNEQAELIITTGKGFRADGTRFPHSWSIVDARECINWMNLHLK
jgi:pimeloyl-ACP methyl ester carboxylesterase